MDRRQQLFDRLAPVHQEQLLRFWPELSPAQQEKLAGQLEAIDFNEMDKLIRDYVLVRPKTRIPEDLGPAPYFPLVPKDEAQRRRTRRSAHSMRRPPPAAPNCSARAR